MGLTGFMPTIWPRLARRQVEHLPAQPITSVGPENSTETGCEEQFLPGQGSSVWPGAGAELLATPPGHGNQNPANSHANFSKINPPEARLRGGFAAPPRPAGRDGASPSPGKPHGSLPHVLLPKHSAPPTPAARTRSCRWGVPKGGHGADQRALKSCGCPVPGGAQGRVGRGWGSLGCREGSLPRQGGHTRPLAPLPTQALCDRTDPGQAGLQDPC